jgi:predicted MFS family arabinose efflux permease
VIGVWTSPLARLLPRIALLLGNAAIGLSVLTPAGMLGELATGLNVGIHDAGLLVTYGAVVLCISSPVGAWLTSRIDRRRLLIATIAILAVGEAATAFAPNYWTVLALRLALLAAAALYTPQAAATAAMIAPERERPGAIAFVFLGWSLAIAAGLPLVTFLTSQFGWRETYLVLAGFGFATCALLRFALPAGLPGSPLSLASFGTIARNPTLTLILLITLLTASGQFTITVYLAPLVEGLTGEGPVMAGVFFAIFGFAGLIGNIAATAAVPKLGAQMTFAISLLLTFIGLMLWSVGAGLLVVMAAGIAVWGLGFLASNSMQQARLAATIPELAGASIALNTSLLYVGQAVGSGIGGLLFVHQYYAATGYVAVAFVIVSALLLTLIWERRSAA